MDLLMWIWALPWIVRFAIGTGFLFVAFIIYTFVAFYVWTGVQNWREMDRAEKDKVLQNLGLRSKK